MKWNEVRVVTTAEAADAVTNILMTNGAGGVQVDDAGTEYQLITYFPATTALPEVVTQIETQVQGLTQYGLNPGRGKVSVCSRDDADWVDKWEKYYHPLRLTRWLTIVPRWEDYQPQQADERLIYLDPGKAFGTGAHPTTRLTLQALEVVVRGGEEMIDVGTGSGILAIYARMLGVSQVMANDISEEAVESAKRNFQLNPQAAPITVSVGNMLDGVTHRVDLITANILPDVLTPLIPQAWTWLKPTGHLLLSGIIAMKKEQLVDALTATGFVLEETFQRGDWVALVARRPGKDE
ncbi:50S ribosomal protein L11 methyltransferase [Ligilactobacillus sp. LYQ60]|uniref:50S ribosomal protein L11 methyltransferase n=1 Tax=unclassified Ligilactobacillus TaxID=2767920 RepID=UPI00385324AA